MTKVTLIANQNNYVEWSFFCNQAPSVGDYVTVRMVHVTDGRYIRIRVCITERDYNVIEHKWRMYVRLVDKLPSGFNPC